MSGVLLRFIEENRRLLTAMLAVLLGNVAFYLLLTGPAQLRVGALVSSLGESEQKLGEVVRDYGRARLEELLLERASGQVEDLRARTFRLSSERFPLVDEKIKEISREFRLNPQSTNYTWREMPEEKLEELTVAFNLKGRYRDLRQFMEKIEQAEDKDGNDLFFSIDRITLADSTQSGSELNLNIAVTTYFHRPDLVSRHSVTRRAGTQRRDSANAPNIRSRGSRLAEEP